MLGFRSAASPQCSAHHCVIAGCHLTTLLISGVFLQRLVNSSHMQHMSTVQVKKKNMSGLIRWGHRLVCVDCIQVLFECTWDIREININLKKNEILKAPLFMVM